MHPWGALVVWCCALDSTTPRTQPRQHLLCGTSQMNRFSLRFKGKAVERDYAYHIAQEVRLLGPFVLTTTFPMATVALIAFLDGFGTTTSGLIMAPLTIFCVVVFAFVSCLPATHKSVLGRSPSVVPPNMRAGRRGGRGLAALQEPCQLRTQDPPIPCRAHSNSHTNILRWV